MKKIIYLIFSISLIIGLGSCGIGKYKTVSKPIKTTFTAVEIETLIEDDALNVRALEVVDEKWAVFATSNGNLGVITDDNYIKNDDSVKRTSVLNDYHSFRFDTITPNFRSIAKTYSTVKNTFVLSIGSPALLFKNDSLVYKENHEKAFYDAMEFWNDQEGIAIGDPTDDCLSVIITRDGGESWTKLSCDVLPKAKEGEAAFAASDTNIAIVGDKTWVATGGKSSRILYSPNKGKTWEVYNTPIVQGLETTGMYSLDFYNELNGFAIGGDYTKANINAANKIRTTDGGKTWELVAQNQGPGYRSCVQYIPNSNAKGLVAVGFKGIDVSNDAGTTWKHLSDQGFYTLRFINDTTAYAAGNGRISKLTFN